MKNFVIVSCLLALVSSQCPPSGCPPPVDPPFCGLPDCSIVQNRIRPDAVWPVQGEPTMFWQCAPLPNGNWGPVMRDCACTTVFNVNERRCSWWFDNSWVVPPGCGWQNPPAVRPCDPWCPTCPPNGPPQITPPPEWTTPPPQWTTAPPPGNPITPEPPGCNCPCPPCIWWPCQPCNPCRC